MTTATLPPEITTRLSTTGATSGWVADRLGCGWRKATKILRAAGAAPGHDALWRLPGATRPRVLMECGRQCFPSERSGVAFGSARDAC